MWRVAVIIVLSCSGLLAQNAQPLEKSVAEFHTLRKQLADQRTQVNLLASYVMTLSELLGDPPAVAAEAAAFPSIDQKMKFVLPPAEFRETGFAQCLEWVGKAARVKLEVDWKALKDIEVDQRTPVTCNLQDATGAMAMRMICARAGRGPHLITWFVDSTAVRVSTMEAIRAHRVTRAFDLADLIADMRGNVETQDLPTNLLIQGAHPPTPENNILRLLVNCVDPCSWREVGGTTGSLSFTGTRMSVTQSPMAMPMVERLLEQVADCASPQRANEKIKAELAKRSREIDTLRARAAGLAARCRKAGKKVPAERILPATGLARVIAQVDFKRTPIPDCLAFLRNAGDIHICANWVAMDDPRDDSTPVDPGTPITLRLEKRTVADVLSQVLQQTVVGRHAIIDSGVDGELVIVSTRDDFNRNATIQVYDVRDLIRLRMRGQTTRADAWCMLMWSIMQNVDHDSWREAGGVIGDLQELAGHFIITQTIPNHRAIEAYLEKLRQNPNP